MRVGVCVCGWVDGFRFRRRRKIEAVGERASAKACAFNGPLSLTASSCSDLATSASLLRVVGRLFPFL